MESTGEVDFNSPSRACTEDYLHWDLSPEQIQLKSDEVIAKYKNVWDAVGSLDLDGVTFNNTVKALADKETECYSQYYILASFKYVSPSKEVRTASTDAENKIQEFIDVSMRKDVYQRILALAMKVDEDSLTAEDKRYIHVWLGESIQDMMKFSSKYINNLRSHITKTGTYKGSPGGLWIEALGMKVDARSLTEVYMETYMQENITHMNELHLPKDKQNKLNDIKKKLINKCNLAIEEVLKLRAQKSALLGFKTYADFALRSNMVRSANKVSIFLDELTHKLKPLGDEESPKAKGTCQLKEYFPLKVVTQGLLDIFQDLLGLSFSLVHGAPVWHPDVTLYCVTDRSCGQTVGQFYLDLLTREGKERYVGGYYAAGYCVPLQPGCLLSDGSRQKAVAAIVTHFNKPKPTANTSLLTHEDVKTLFHEFGHVMHYLCAQVDYAVFSAFHVEKDFVEVPSQMLENWVWEKEPLQRISKHYKTGAPIPDDLLDKLIKSHPAIARREFLAEIELAKLDQRLHTNPESLGVLPSQESTLDAQYYGYLWSEVLAMDMFYSRFKREGIMNPKVGLDYRNCILKPGGSENATEMLRNFLGREPNQDALIAFLQSQGLKVSTCSDRRSRSRCWRKD